MPAPAIDSSIASHNLRLRHTRKSQHEERLFNLKTRLPMSTKKAAPKSNAVPLNPIDDMFVRMEAPERNLAVASLFWVEGDVEIDTVLSLMQRLIDAEAKFRQRCVPGTFLKPAYWIDMSDDNKYDASDNVKPLDHPWSVQDQLDLAEFNSAAITPGMTMEEYEEKWIEDRFSEHAGTVFDTRLPLWRMLLMRGLPNKRSVIAMVAHHCMADGQGFAHVMSKIMSPVDDESIDQKVSQPTTAPTSSSMPSETTNEKPKNQAKLLKKNSNYMDTPNAFILAAYTQLEYFLAVFMHILLVIWYSALSMTRMAFYNRHSFRCTEPQRQEKRAAWSKAMSINDIKVVRKAYPGTTLNDVMVACLERSFTAYMDSIDQDAISGQIDPEILKKRNHTRDQVITLTVPKGLRGANDTRFENLAGIEYLLLPLLPQSAPTSTALSHATKHMNRVKMAQLAPFMRSTASILSALSPGFLSSPVINTYMDKLHGILTNVPGSPKQLYFTNGDKRHRILSSIMYPPALFAGSTGIAICSYNGDVTLGAVTDDMPEYPDQARKIVNGMHAAFEKMLEDAYEKLQQQN
ncbi:hypothetical protein BDF19DRAFT_449532 [Syncephalis fuscata]|nr:hypothetical protein BDF19DRAFT_449532 [Syncephalis fuscata]